MLDILGLAAINEDRFRKVNYEVQEWEDYTTDLPYWQDNYESCIGGSVVNTLINLSRIGFKVGILGLIGNDDTGTRLLRRLSEENIQFLGKIVNGYSGVAEIEIDVKGSRRIIIHPGVNDLISKELIRMYEEYITNSELLHTSTFACSLNYEPIYAQIEATSIAKKVSLTFGVLYCKIFMKNRELIDKLLQNINLLFINENEIKIITEKLSYIDAVDKLLNEYSIDIVSVTLGSKGAHTFTRSNDYFIEALKVSTIDTTGAGDAYVSGFLAGYLLNKDLKTCTYWGILCASRCVQTIGAVNYAPPEEIINEFRRLRL